MFGAWTYLIWLALFIGLPLILLAGWRRRALQRRSRGLAWVLLGSLIGGWAWDALAVRWGLWYYNSEHLVGFWLAGLPLEEWLWIGSVTLLFSGLTVPRADRAEKEP